MVEFNETVRGVSSSTFYLRDNVTGARLSALVSYDWTTRRAVLDPVESLRVGHIYTVYLTSAIYDKSGNTLSPSIWRFGT